MRKDKEGEKDQAGKAAREGYDKQLDKQVMGNERKGDG